MDGNVDESGESAIPEECEDVTNDSLRKSALFLLKAKEIYKTSRSALDELTADFTELCCDELQSLQVSYVLMEFQVFDSVPFLSQSNNFGLIMNFFFKPYKHVRITQWGLLCFNEPAT